MHHKRVVNHGAVSYSRTASFPYELGGEGAPGED